MAKYFLASVGTAEAFRMVNGKRVLAFRSKTLTDSGINITTTKDDIRAGTGAPIQFSFYHDPNVEITLTDVLFDQSYVEAQLGTQFKVGGNKYESETVTGTSAILKYDPVELNMGCGNSEVVIWYTEKGKDEWEILDQAEINGKTITLPEEKDYCVRYVRHDANSQIAEISSDMIPEELFLVITAPIYAGDACSASNGKSAGTITYEIPRFKLNGAQEFTMNMSSNQTMSLSGVALASADGCDITGATLLNIITNYDDYKWYDHAEELVADQETVHIGDEPKIYAVFANGSVSLIDNDELDFNPELNSDDKWKEPAGEETVTAKGKADLKVTVTTLAKE